MALARTVEARDNYTESTCIAWPTGRSRSPAAMGMTERQVESVRLGGLLHDLGKIAVPDGVLHKPGRWIAGSSRSFASTPKPAPRSSGRCEPSMVRAGGPASPRAFRRRPAIPTGFEGADIPLAARVVAVADAFDAMTRTAPYRDAIPVMGLPAARRSDDGRQWDSRRRRRLPGALRRQQPDDGLPRTLDAPAVRAGGSRARISG